MYICITKEKGINFFSKISKNKKIIYLFSVTIDRNQNKNYICNKNMKTVLFPKLLSIKYDTYATY